MKKNILALFALVSVLALMPSCTKIKEMFTPKYNTELMVSDCAKFKREGNDANAQRLFDKLMELDSLGTNPLMDHHYDTLEQYFTLPPHCFK